MRGTEKSGKREVGWNHIESAIYFKGDVFYGEGKERERGRTARI